MTSWRAESEMHTLAMHALQQPYAWPWRPASGVFMRHSFDRHVVSLRTSQHLRVCDRCIFVTTHKLLNPGNFTNCITRNCVHCRYTKSSAHHGRTTSRRETLYHNLRRTGPFVELTLGFLEPGFSFPETPKLVPQTVLSYRAHLLRRCVSRIGS